MIGTTPTGSGQPLQFTLQPGERWVIINLVALVQDMNTYGVPWLSLSKGGLTHADLDLLKNVATLETLGLTGAWRDIDLQGLANLTQVEELSLNRTALTDAGLVHLSALTQLVVLDLARTAVTNSGLTHLQNLTALESLLLLETGLAGGTLTNLQTLTNLRILHLGWTAVNDAGLQSLSGYLPALESLHHRIHQ